MSYIPLTAPTGALRTVLLVAALLMGGASVGHSQQVVLFVDGEPITALDIAHRMKLIEMSTHKPSARQEVIEGLIDEVLEVREAKHFGIDVPDPEVQRSYASVASRMGADPQKLTQMLTSGGASEQTLKHRLKAELAWTALIRGRFKSSLEVADTDVEAQLQLHTSPEKKSVGYEYIVRPIVFIVPHGSPDAAYEARKREADALRTRFQKCEEGIPFARALREVAVRDQIIKFSADLPAQSREILDNTPVGHLTPPDQVTDGLQMFAVCSKRESKNDTPEKKNIREEMFQKKFTAKSKRYLEELRRSAMIEYK